MLDDAMESVREVMRGFRRLPPARPDNFALETSDAALSFFDELKGKLILFGTALPAIGLVVGAMVIMNIMLVAVAERTREIGIRKALGAKRRDILSQFLVESATLSVVRGRHRHRARDRARQGDRRRVAAPGERRAVVDRRSRCSSARAWGSSPGCIRRAGPRGSTPSRPFVRSSAMRLLDRLTIIKEGIGIAMDAIRSNKVRASLTIMGVAVGVFVVTAMAAAVHGIRASFQSDVDAFGATSFQVRRRGIELGGCDGTDENCPERRNPALTLGEAAAIRRLPDVQAVTVIWGDSKPFRYHDRYLGSRLRCAELGVARDGRGRHLAGAQLLGPEGRPRLAS